MEPEGMWGIKKSGHNFQEEAQMKSNVEASFRASLRAGTIHLPDSALAAGLLFGTTTWHPGCARK